MHRLTKASDKRNPYLPQIAKLEAEIRQIQDEIKWNNLAREKMDEWNQKDQESRASKGKRIPLPRWLCKYDPADAAKLLDKENRLSGQKWLLLQDANKFRIHDNYNYNTGGTECQK